MVGTRHSRANPALLHRLSVVLYTLCHTPHEGSQGKGSSEPKPDALGHFGLHSTHNGEEIQRNDKANSAFQEKLSKDTPEENNGPAQSVVSYRTGSAMVTESASWERRNDSSARFVRPLPVGARSKNDSSQISIYITKRVYFDISILVPDDMGE